MRSAISPRQATATHSKGGLTSRGSRRSRKAAMPSRPSVGGAPLGDRLAPPARACGAGSPSRSSAISALAARTASGPPRSTRREHALDGRRRAPSSSACTSCTRPIACACVGVEQLAGEEQRARLRAADARERERRDRRRDEPEAHLGEAEARVLAREHDVAAAGEARAAAERGAVHARDHGHRAAVDGREHRRGELGVGQVALVRELARGAHPLEVAAGAERLPATRDDDGAQRRRRPRAR